MHSDHVLPRIAAFTLVAFLTLAAVPVTAASEEVTNGALDPAGDVYPTAWAAALPGVVPHAELLDLTRFEVKHESQNDFVIEVALADLPDKWLLEPAAPGGKPVPPIQVSPGLRFEWDDSFLQNKVVHSVYFAIDGKKYEVRATLAEVNLENPNEFPKANSTKYVDILLQAARANLSMAKELVLQTPFVAQGAAVSKIDAADRELANASSDLSAECAQDCSDVLNALEQARFHLAAAKTAVQGLAFPDLRTPIETALGAADRQVQDAAAKAPSAEVQGTGAAPAAPDRDDVENVTVVLFHRFELHWLNPPINVMTAPTELGGLVDLELDTLRMTVKKSDVGAKKDLKLTEFRAVANFKGVKVDYAPDALAGNPTPTQILMGVTDQQVVTPAFGKDYTFAVEANPAATQLPARIQLSPVGPASVEVPAGGSATFYVTMKNVAATPLTGFFTLSPDGDGWSSQLSDPIWSLGPGSSQVVTLAVAGVSGADPEKITRLTATVDGGEDAFTELRTTLKESPPEQVSGGGGEKAAKKGGLPGFEAVGLIGVSLALVVVARRRLRSA